MAPYITKMKCEYYAKLLESYRGGWDKVYYLWMSNFIGPDGIFFTKNSGLSLAWYAVRLFMIRVGLQDRLKDAIEMGSFFVGYGRWVCNTYCNI